MPRSLLIRNRSRHSPAISPIPKVLRLGMASSPQAFCQSAPARAVARRSRALKMGVEITRSFPKPIPHAWGIAARQTRGAHQSQPRRLKQLSRPIRGTNRSSKSGKVGFRSDFSLLRTLALDRIGDSRSDHSHNKVIIFLPYGILARGTWPEACLARFKPAGFCGICRPK